MKLEICPICKQLPTFYLSPFYELDGLHCANCGCFNVEPVRARTLFGLQLKWNYLMRSYLRRTKRREKMETRRTKGD